MNNKTETNCLNSYEEVMNTEKVYETQRKKNGIEERKKKSQK